MKTRSFAVIGLGRFGSATARALAELKQEVIGLDTDEERVKALSDTLSYTAELDATDERALRASGVQDVDVAIVSIGTRIEASLLVVMILKELGVKTVVAKATTALHGRILTKLGVSRVVFPEREVALRLASSLVVPNVLDYIELSRGFSIAEFPAPEAFVGRTLRALELRPRFGLTLIAIKRQVEGREATIIAPGADEEIQAGDVLALLGPNQALHDLTARVSH